MKLLQSFRNRSTVELPGEYVCNQDFIDDVRRGLEHFADRKNYRFEEEVSGPAISMDLSRNAVNGFFTNFKEYRLETELEQGRVYDSLDFNDRSYRINLGNKTDATAPYDDLKALESEISTWL